MSAEYRVLGPLEVLLDGEPVFVPAGRVRILLAMLLLRANEFVPVDELVERVWDGAPPDLGRADKTLQTVVSRLRSALGAANCVRWKTGGYYAEVAPEQLDLLRFRQHVEAGEFAAGLALWRGPALGNVTSELLHRDDVPPLVEEQIVALERRIDQDLTRDTDALVGELRTLVTRYPLRETFWAQLMLALHRSNRQAEALEVYGEVRELLAEQLGVDPGARLREAHRQVLAGEVPENDVPRQLPVRVPHFVGRERELARLTDMLDVRPRAPVLIAVISGVGGVGKTALALQWADRVADRFPDGQLYVNLRGFDTSAEPLDPITVVRDFLRALGVKPSEIPASEDALLSHYRSVLAERRMLLLLDNASDTEQVRPLLPGGSANVVLITSRNQLRGLVVREGARPIALGVLDDQGALDLLTERIGSDRVAAEAPAAARLVARCAGLPLALGIVAASAVFQDSLAALADEMDSYRLDALEIDDSSGVRAVFSWSLRSLSAPAARLFVVLGLHPGPDFTTAAAASLVGLPLAQTRRLLTELVSGSLVSVVNSSRFALHDLLRDFAAEQVAELPQDDRERARLGMFEHYLHTSLAANLKIEISVSWPPLASPSRDVVVVAVPDVTDALEWFRVEHQVLLGVVAMMVRSGADDLAWRLGYTLHPYLLRRGLLDAAETAELVALGSVQRLGDVFGQARLHRSLGGVYIAKQELDQADFHLSSALRCEIELGNVNGRSNVSRGLAYVYERQGRDADAVQILQRVHSTIDDVSSVYERACHRMGEHERAIELCRRSEVLFGETDRTVPDMPMAMNQETLGDIYLALGRHADAVASYQAAVLMLRAMKHTFYLADRLVLLAKAHLATGEPEPARQHLDEALSIYDELGNAKAVEVREFLASLP